MKTIKLGFLLILFLSIISCSDEEPLDNCAQWGWVGNYEGTKTSNGDINTVSIQIAPDGSDHIVIAVFEETATGVIDSNFDPFPVDGCEFQETFETSDGTLELNGSKNRSEINLTTITTKDGVITTCTIIVTRD